MVFFEPDRYSCQKIYSIYFLTVLLTNLDMVLYDILFFN